MQNLLEKELTVGNKVLVRINIKYPTCQNRNIDSYINKIIAGVNKFAHDKLAKEALINSKESPENFKPFSIVMNYKVGIDSENMFSFYFDIFVWRQNGEIKIRRIPINFDKKSAHIIFPLGKKSKRGLFSALNYSLQKINTKNVFYPDLISRAHRNFKKTNAFISEKGLFITYDSGILAPHAKGAVNIFLLSMR